MNGNTRIRSGRLSKSEVDDNFSDLHPALTQSEALIEADRCYFCYDAPCTTACPTSIDIPTFIRQIRSDNLLGSAHTILRENIFGGLCARVCPTEILCEEACVRNAHEEKPVEIGLLQRHATDPVIEHSTQLFERAPSSGKKIAVVGAGPAGLSCAHRLAVLGHDVVVFNRHDKPGGLNEYGIAAYKATGNFAQSEIDYILSIGGIELQNNLSLGIDITLAELRDDYDAVFLGTGLALSKDLDIGGDDLQGVVNAIDYIADLRQSADKSSLPVGRDIVVIGGGMTAIDIAVQSKLLGARQVHLVYRRGPEQMGASVFEQSLAQTSGVVIHHWASPEQILGSEFVTGVEFSVANRTEGMHLDADIVFKAIGQQIDTRLDSLATDRGRIIVDNHQKTSLDGVWAGGDCVADGENLTVSATQHGKIAAIDIDQSLRGL